MTSLPLSYAEGCKKRQLSSLAIDKETWEQLSLVEKWKTSYRNEYIDQSIRKVAEGASICVFWFSCVTELYTFLLYLIPELFSEYSAAFRIAFSLFVTYVFGQATVHWMFTRFVDSDFKKPPSFPAPPGGHKQCHICNINKPPRTHHCKVCDTCIKKRDHHCFFTGTCVGFWNQRYFIVMNFHVAGASLGGLFFTYLYIVQNLTVTSPWDYFLPVTCYNFVLGNLEVKYLIMMVHMYSLWITGGMAVFFLLTQIGAIVQGKTTHEISKRLKVRSTASVGERFRSVFGKYWMLNFFFPTQLCWIQDGDGIHWQNFHMG